jgi:hypothetical protein
MVSQLSTVSRVIFRETFIGFIEISADRSSDCVFSHVQNAAWNLNLGFKRMTGYRIWADTWMVFSMYYWRHNHPVFMYTGLCKCWTLFFLRALTLLNKSAYFFLEWDFYFCITFICENLKLSLKSEEKNTFFSCHQVNLHFSCEEHRILILEFLEALRGKMSGVQMFIHYNILFHTLQTKGLNIVSVP